MSAPVIEPRVPSIRRLIGFAVLLTVVSWGLGAFGAFPWTASDPTVGILNALGGGSADGDGGGSPD